MKQCYKCGMFVGENDEVCGACGSNLKNNNNTYNPQINNVAVNTSSNIMNNSQVQPVINENNNLNQVNRNQMPNLNQNDIAVNSNISRTVNNQVAGMNSYNNASNYIDSDELLKCYIGDNYEKLSNNGFSWCTFFLEVIYIFYRKKYVWGITWILIIFILMGFNNNLILFVGSLVLRISQSITFKKTYIKESKKSVEKIIQNNPNKSFQELKNICTSAGGTSMIVPVILFIIVLIGIGSTIFNAIAVHNNIKNMRDRANDLYGDKSPNSTDTNSNYSDDEIDLYAYLDCVEVGIAKAELNSELNNDALKIVNLTDDYCENDSIIEPDSIYLEVYNRKVNGTLNYNGHSYKYEDDNLTKIY